MDLVLRLLPCIALSCVIVSTSLVNNSLAKPFNTEKEMHGPYSENVTDLSQVRIYVEDGDYTHDEKYGDILNLLGSNNAILNEKWEILVHRLHQYNIAILGVFKQQRLGDGDIFPNVWELLIYDFYIYNSAHTQKTWDTLMDSFSQFDVANTMLQNIMQRAVADTHGTQRLSAQWSSLVLAMMEYYMARNVVEHTIENEVASRRPSEP